MLGEVEENSEKNGIIPRAVDHIFSFIRSQHADAPIDDEEAALNAKIVSNTLGEVQFLISLSFLEIYKSDTQTHRPELGHFRARVSACGRRCSHSLTSPLFACALMILQCAVSTCTTCYRSRPARA